MTIVATDTKTKHAQHVADLRAAADWLEAHPDLPIGRYPTVHLQYVLTDADYPAHGGTFAEVDRVAAEIGTDCVIEDYVHTDGIRYYLARYPINGAMKYSVMTSAPAPADTEAVTA